MACDLRLGEVVHQFFSYKASVSTGRNDGQKIEKEWGEVTDSVFKEV